MEGIGVFIVLLFQLFCILEIFQIKKSEKRSERHGKKQVLFFPCMPSVCEKRERQAPPCSHVGGRDRWLSGKTEKPELLMMSLSRWRNINFELLL